ncbi:hypothetical protein BU23DRAFT_571743 [Bimuria novae-zelandiae CBS 107.79]|uniref:Uncharacterized protein n=1 Tax=Bimuria novae-zelandiae CBS 107.79 TaxID=1447943 RepID=A0A6A5UWS3_9PLEO|nr:hypothetical protein BU23DRAFT_571743 [Bimuria novae-zelandiae CBS 107.79]
MDLLSNSAVTGIHCKEEALTEILTCIDLLLETLEEAQGTFHLFSDRFDRLQELKLRRSIPELSIAILDAVETMVTWFDQRARHKAFKILLKQSDYVKNFEGIIGAIGNRADTLRRVANECHQIVNVSTNEMFPTMGQKLHTLEAKTSVTNQLLEHINNTGLENDNGSTESN